MRIKSFNEYITEELRKVISDQSGSGKTKSVEWIWDEPTSAKSPSAGVSLKDELRELEFQDLIKTLSHDELDNKSKSRLRKERFKSKSDKLAVTLNNLRFLKDEQKEKGELRCEYCGRGPLVIYDITEDELKRGPQKIDGKLRFNTKFNPKDGATCDHKQPQSKGGDKFDYSNLAVCCYRCNQRKGNMDWEKWSDVLNNRQFNESIIPLKNYMKELTGLDEEDLQDNLLELSDEYDLKFEPGMFFLDEYGRPKVSNHWDIKDQVEFIRYIDSNRVKHINGKMVPDLDDDTNFAWGWIVEFWKKGEPTYRNNRVCDKQTISRTYNKINQNRLESLGLDSSVVMTHSTGGGNVDNDIYAIAIWTIN